MSRWIDSARRWTYDLSRFGARMAGVTLFRLRCTGRENFPDTGPVIVCANHQSYLDPVIVGLTCHRRLNYLARRSLFRFAPFGWLIDWYDAIPIEREGLGIGGLKETLRRLKRGEMVLVFPEGTRTRDGHVGTLQPGFCALARRGQTTIVPVGIDGAYQAWPRGRWLPRRSSIHVHIGSPMSVEEIRKLSDAELMDAVRNRLCGCHARARAFRG